MMSSRKARGTLTALLAAAVGILVLALPAAASAKDRNHDKIPDKWEKHYNLSLKVNQAHRNPDRDALTNKQEFRAGDNPRKRDTNGDGIPDGEDNAGTVGSFDSTTGLLTINLFDGSTVSGTVDSNTEISCDSSSDDQSGDDDSGDTGGTGGGDKMSSSGTTTSEDDNSGDSGDDDSGDNGGNCSAADLVPGAVVHEAELSVDSSGAVFDQIDLVGTGTGTGTIDD